MRALFKNWKLSAIAAFSLTIAMALAIVAFSINSTTGVLTQLPLAQGGCVEGGTPVDGCEGATALTAPESLTLSANGQRLYATSYDSSSIAVFDVNTQTGGLTHSGFVALTIGDDVAPWSDTLLDPDPALLWLRVTLDAARHPPAASASMRASEAPLIRQIAKVKGVTGHADEDVRLKLFNQFNLQRR